MILYCRSGRFGQFAPPNIDAVSVALQVYVFRGRREAPSKSWLRFPGVAIVEFFRHFPEVIDRPAHIVGEDVRATAGP